MVPFGTALKEIKMNNDEAIQVAFRALSDSTRRDIIMMLSEQDMTIGDVVKKFEITRAAVKKHLIILEQGNLISVHQQGRERINRLNPVALKTANDWLNHFSRFWDNKLSKLQQVIEQDTKD